MIFYLPVLQSVTTGTSSAFSRTMIFYLPVLQSVTTGTSSAFSHTVIFYLTVFQYVTTATSVFFSYNDLLLMPTSLDHDFQLAAWFKIASLTQLQKQTSLVVLFNKP